QLLMGLAAKVGLDYDEIVGAYARRRGRIIPKTPSRTILANNNPVPSLKWRSSSLAKLSSRLRIHQKPVNKKPKRSPEMLRMVFAASSIRVPLVRGRENRH